MGMFDWLRRNPSKKSLGGKSKASSGKSGVQPKNKSSSKTTDAKTSQSRAVTTSGKSRSRKTQTGNIKTIFPDGTRKVKTPDGREIFKPPAKKTAAGKKTTRYSYDRKKSKKK